jgi:malate synthase
VAEEIGKLGGDPARFDQARALFMEVAVADDFADFLTLPAYERMP